MEALSHLEATQRSNSLNPDAINLSEIELWYALCNRVEQETVTIPDGIEKGWLREGQIVWDELPR
jgi:hypothetical protein